MNITVYDPWVNPTITRHEYGIDVVNELSVQKFDAAIAAVVHKEFENMDVRTLFSDAHVIFNVKCILNRGVIDVRL